MAMALKVLNKNYMYINNIILLSLKLVTVFGFSPARFLSYTFLSFSCSSTTTINQRILSSFNRLGSFAFFPLIM